MSCLFFVSLRKEAFPFLSFVVKRVFGVHRLRWRRRAGSSKQKPESTAEKLTT
jgi:hypothetical protein